MIHSTFISGLPVQTGDLICTTDGEDQTQLGQVWRAIGQLLPGPVDHIVIYLGPGRRCAEAGPKGVNTFELPTDDWQAARMFDQRGPLADTLYGVAYPLAERGLAPEPAAFIRASVAAYVLKQAAARKPYNVNFFDCDTEQAFYCSQLAYRAYRPHGINLNTGLSAPNLPGSQSIVFPMEIWAGLPHRRPAEA